MRPLDEDLFEAWRGGDVDAGVELVERHYDSVFAFFHGKVGPELAGELSQDTFASLTAARERFRQQSSVRTYLFAIARWKLTEHLRARSTRCIALDDEILDHSPANQSSMASWLEGRQRESLLVVALRSLPLDDQILLELKGYEELSLRELAEIFVVPVGTMASRVRRVRKRLAEIIREYADNPALVEETMTGLDTYMRSLRARLIHAGPGRATSTGSR